MSRPETDVEFIRRVCAEPSEDTKRLVQLCRREHIADASEEAEARALRYRNQCRAEVRAMAEGDEPPFGTLQEALDMLRRWTREAQPVNDRGQVTFTRALLESTEDALDWHLQQTGTECADLRRALGVACGLLIRHEPGDSRAVSDVFVALSSIASGHANAECWSIVDQVCADQSTNLPEPVVESSPLILQRDTLSRWLFDAEWAYSNTEKEAPGQADENYGIWRRRFDMLADAAIAYVKDPNEPYVPAPRKSSPE